MDISPATANHQQRHQDCRALVDSCARLPGSTKLTAGALRDTLDLIAKRLPPSQAELLLKDVQKSLEFYARYKANRRHPSKVKSERSKGAG